MTLRELQGELEQLDATLQRLRRADYEIPGDPVRAIGLRQHIVEVLQDVRTILDQLTFGLDKVDDVDKIKTIRERLTGSVQKLLGGKDGND